MQTLASIWQEVGRWPREQRLALATRLLQSLELDEAVAPISKERREALLGLIGCWKMENPPDDEEVERIIEEERMKKYG